MKNTIENHFHFMTYSTPGSRLHNCSLFLSEKQAAEQNVFQTYKTSHHPDFLPKIFTKYLNRRPCVIIVGLLLMFIFSNHSSGHWTPYLKLLPAKFRHFLQNWRLVINEVLWLRCWEGSVDDDGNIWSISQPWVKLKVFENSLTFFAWNCIFWPISLINFVSNFC